MPDENIDPAGNTEAFRAFASAEPEPAGRPIGLIVAGAILAVAVLAIVIWMIVG